MTQASSSTQDWETFEEECYEYLKAKYPHADFDDLGKHNSNVPDIAVRAQHDDFYMEIKKPVAQSGQFVLKPLNGKFIFSPNNKTTPNEYTERMISEMNRDFAKYSNAGTSGEKLDLSSAIFYGWIMDYYAKKGVKYFISKKNNYVIFPTEKLPEYFDVSAVYRVKKSGSTDPSANNLLEILSASNGNIEGYNWEDGKLYIASSFYNDGDKFDEFFSAPGEWGVSIEDIHDNEENPHYVLTVGTEQFEKLPKQTYFIRYCDYHSIPSAGRIVTNPGNYYITIWMYEDRHNTYNSIASKIEKAYYDAMTKHLPGYAILTSRPMYSKTPG